jgi:hypothetical protein
LKHNIGEKTMKRIVTLLCFVFAFGAFAASETFTFNGAQRSNSVNLQSEKWHTEYRYERRADTCYRREFAGYRQQCRRVRTGSRCTTRNGRRVCTPTYTRRCTRVAVYRTVPYTCYRDVRVPYQVFDYYVDAAVNFTFGELPQGTTAREDFTVNLNGDAENTSVRSSGNLLILANKSVESYMNGDTKMMSVNYFVEFMDLQKAIAPIQSGIQLREIEDGKFRFEVGKMSEAFGYKVALKVKRKRFLLSDPVLVNRTLNQDDYRIIQGNTSTIIEVDAAKVNVSLNKGRYEVTLQVGLDVDHSAVLNASDIPNLKAKMKKKFKVKKNGDVVISMKN